MKTKLLFNPFEKFSELTFLMLGTVSLLIASWIAAAFHIIYDGVINIHLTTEQSFVNAVLQNVIAVLILFIFLYGIGIAVNRRTRIVDALNISLTFRLPLYLMSLTIPIQKPILDKLPDVKEWEHFKPSGIDMALLTAMGFISIAALIYAVVLLVNGFKTATNSKKWYHIVYVLLGLLLADFIAKQIILNAF